MAFSLALHGRGATYVRHDKTLTPYRAQPLLARLIDRQTDAHDPHRSAWPRPGSPLTALVLTDLRDFVPTVHDAFCRLKGGFKRASRNSMVANRVGLGACRQRLFQALEERNAGVQSQPMMTDMALWLSNNNSAPKVPTSSIATTLGLWSRNATTFSSTVCTSLHARRTPGCTPLTPKSPSIDRAMRHLRFPSASANSAQLPSSMARSAQLNEWRAFRDRTDHHRARSACVDECIDQGATSLGGNGD